MIEEPYAPSPSVRTFDAIDQLVSICGCIARLIERLHDPRLSKNVNETTKEHTARIAPTSINDRRRSTPFISHKPIRLDTRVLHTFSNRP